MCCSNGTAPAAGIDLEPDGSYYDLENVTIRDCFAVNNTGHGLQSWLNSGEANNVSVLIERYHVIGAGKPNASFRPRKIVWKRSRTKRCVPQELMLDAKTVTVANVLSSKRTQDNGETWESIRVNVTWPRELRVADDPPNTPFGVSEAAPVWDTSAKLLRLLFKATDVTKGCCACGSESVADHCCYNQLCMLPAARSEHVIWALPRSHPPSLAGG